MIKRKENFLIDNLGTNLSHSYVNSMGNSSWVELTQSTWLVNPNLFHFYLGLKYNLTIADAKRVIITLGFKVCFLF
jgi:hypothetical protein